MTIKEIVDKKIKDITEKIVKEYKPEKIILFGSYAWGHPTESSDVDLFIIKNSDKKKWEREYELRLKIFPPSLPFDLLIYTPKEIQKRLKMGDFFINDIINKGKVLYEYSG
ncbi:nucleotidyltransferase domain-containing protein [Candidatus Wolfebacteria bacterium]|nr:nucleotidyltransferase domain-containing protein [Candidatus Wolfebacteria bacterium]